MITHVLTDLIVKYFQKKYPNEKNEDLHLLNVIEENKKSFKVWISIVSFGIIFLMVILTYVFGEICIYLNKILSDLSSQDSVNSYYGINAIYYAVGFCLMFHFIYPIYTYILKLIFKEKFEAFIYFSNQHFKYNNEQAFQIISKIMLFITIPFIVFTIPTYYRFNKNEIEYKPLFSLISYQEKIDNISKIVFIEGFINNNGVYKENKHYLVSFKNLNTVFDSQGFFNKDSVQLESVKNISILSKTPILYKKNE